MNSRNTTMSRTGRTWRLGGAFVGLLFALLSLQSTGQVYTVVPTGGTVGNTDGTGADPVCRYFNGIKYQVVYTVAEMNAAGIVGAQSITKLAWNVTTSSVSLGNYTIKMGNTAAANSATNNVDAVSTVKTAFTYAVAAGFNDITFDTPFAWNGSQNLVIEVCTGPTNPFTTPYGGVQAKTGLASGACRAVRADGAGAATICTNNAGGALTTKPYVRLTVAPSGACSGTPAPGATTTSAASPCSGAPFTLGLANVTNGTGVSYVWQSSPDNVAPYVTIGGSPNAATFATTQVAPTYYQCIVTCGVNSGTSTPVLVGQTTGACACAPYPSSVAGDPADEEITNVTVGSMNNNSICGAVAGGAGSIAFRYSNYANIVAGPSATPGTLGITFSLTQTSCGGSFGNGFKMYIDWNQDGDFLDANETVYQQPTAATGNHSKTGTFNVPIAATVGSTRMRIVNVETTFPNATNYSNTAYTWGETEDYCFTVTAPPPCSGTPTPGNTLSTASAVCPAVPFTLSVQNDTPGAGVTFQWQNSPDGIAWSNIGGATSISLTTTQAAATYYRCVVTCAGNDGPSIGLQVGSNSGACLCAVYIASTATLDADEEITNVTVGALNNTSICGANPGSGSVPFRYSNYTGSVTGPTHQQGETGVPFSLTQTSCGGAFGNGFKVYIDWNQDGDFLDANEKVYSQPVAATGNHTKTGTFNVPALATVGSTRMRVVVVEAGFPNVTNYSNTTYTWGETEDYCFTVTVAPPCTGTPNSGTAATANVSVCASGETASLSVTGLSFGLGITFQWEESASFAGPYTDVVGGTGATTNSYTTAAITGTKYYRLRTNCSNTIPPADVAYSNVITVTIVPCDYDVMLMPASYTPITGTGNTYTFQGTPFNGDDVISTTVSLAGTTFLYQGQAVTGFQACTNGWMTFNTANLSASFSNGLTATTPNRVLAPFWDDLVTTGNSIPSLTTSLHYQVIGTLGSGSAVIIAEWAAVERFSIPGPNLNFQVRLYEGSNVIEYVYGNFEGFDGTFNSGYSYSLGFNGPNPAGLTARNRFAMQTAVTNHWSAAGDPATHVIMPECFTKFVMTPGTYTGPVSAPPIPVPANNELATAQVLTPNSGPCVALCGTYYTSRGATASADPTSCAGVADDDVWFTFTGNGVDSYTATVRSSPGYNGDMEIFNAGVPVVCQSATAAGLTETYNLGVVSGARDIRVFHNLAGIGGSGQFSICVNTVGVPPVNDDICGAVGLSTSGSCVNTLGNMTNASASPQAACTGTPNRDMWYSFSPLTTGDQIRVQSLGTVNSVLQVFSSSDNTCAGTLTSLTCTNSTSTGGLETYSGPWTLGQTYFIRVYHFNGGSASGLFNICITGLVPGCLVTSVPANAGTLCTTGGAATISWTAVSGASAYDVYFDAGAGPAVTLVSFEQAGTTYNTPALANGQYAWRLTPKNAVGDAVGCTSRTFTVASSPVATITAGGPTSFCSPGSVVLTANNPVGSTRVWSPGGATTLSITATATGNYTVAVTVGPCTTTSSPMAVTAQSAPVAGALTATPSIICSGGASALSVAGSYNYCPSTHANGCASGDAIVNVELEDLSFASPCSPGAYFDYTPTMFGSASLSAQTIYSLDVTMGPDGSQFAGAWIDYNSDGDFDDLGEFLGANAISAGSNGTATIGFETPADAVNGSLRMRIVAGNDVPVLATQSCGASSSPWGETEDYTINMSGGTGVGFTYSWTPTNFLDDPLSQTPVASGVAPLPYTFTVTVTSPLSCTGTGTVQVIQDVTDTDSDGVIDCLDNCPTTPGVEGGPCVLNPSPYLSGTLVACVCTANACTQPVIIELRADAGHANEAGWEILSTTNFVVCKGGYLDVAYGPNQIPQTDFCCLEAGSYRLRVYDSVGDGFVSAGNATGGYQLREATGGQRRIIDNFKNFTNLAGGPPDISALSTTLDNGRFDLPVGSDAAIFTSCDKEDWVNYQFIVATENPLVSAQFVSNPTNSGYEFWFFDPNGTYSYRRFRSHSTTDGTGSGATRACHFKINKNVPLPPGNQATNLEIPYSKLLNVRIRGRANGSNLTFGPACRFKIDLALAACPIVKLQDNPATSDYSCGVSKYFGGVTGGGNRIVATPPQFTPAAPAGMVRFQFRFRIPGEIPNPGSCIVRPPQTSATIPLNWTAGDRLKCNTQYEVDVRVSKDGGLTWCVDAPSPACSGVGYTAWGKVCTLNITTSTFCPQNLSGGGSSNLAVQGNGTLTMFPNPNRGDQVFISLSEVATGVSTVSVDIYDLSGKKVTARTIAVQDGNVNTYLKLNGDLAGGMYMVNITAGDKTYTERLVIQP